MEETRNLYTKDKALILKGMAIVLMVWHHTFRAEGFFDQYAVSFAPFSQSQVVTFALMAKVCVAIFVFVSGYGLYLSLDKVEQNSREYSRWIKNRLVTLIASFMLVFLLITAAMLIFDPGKLSSTFLADGKLKGLIYFLINLIGLREFFGTPILNGAWWYISAAILFIVIAPIARLLLKRFGGMLVLAVSVLVPRVFATQIAGDNQIYKYLLIFLFGMEFAHSNLVNRILLYDLPHVPRVISKGLKLATETVLLVIIYTIGTRLPTEQFWEVNYALLPLVLILFILEFISVIPLVNKVLVFIGYFSMDIYLVHNYARVYFSDYLYQVKWFWLSPLIMLAFGTVMALILYLIKKIIHFDQFTKWLVSRKKEQLQ